MARKNGPLTFIAWILVFFWWNFYCLTFTAAASPPAVYQENSPVNKNINPYQYQDFAGQAQALRRYPARSLQQWTLTDVLLVSTIDGSLEARDRKTGLELWSIPGERPLVSTVSTLDKNAQGEDKDVTWIVEPLGDGTLYKFTPTYGLQKLPATIKQMVSEAAFSIGDKAYTGSRHTTLFSINATDGHILNVYGAEPSSSGLGKAVCKSWRFSDKDSSSSSPDDDEFDVGYAADKGTFQIGRTDYNLEIHGANDTIWRVTYSVWRPNHMDSDLAAQHLSSLDGLYVTPLPSKEIVAFDTNSKKPAQWVREVSSMVVSVFDVMRSSAPSSGDANNRDGSLVLLSQPQFPYNSSIEAMGTYVEMTESGTWFALSGIHFPSLITSAPSARWYTTSEDLRSQQDLKDLISGVHMTQMHNEADTWLSPGGYPADLYHPLSTPGLLDPASSSLPGASSPSELSSSSSASGFPVVPWSNPQDVVLYYYNDGRANDLHQPGSDGHGRPPHGFKRPMPDQFSLPPPSPQLSPWRHFLMRLVENVMAVLLVGGLVMFVASKGWLPQLVLLVKGERDQIFEKKDIQHLQIQHEKVSDHDESDTPSSVTEHSRRGSTESNKGDQDDHVKFADTEQPAREKSGKKRKRGSRGGRKLAAREAVKNAYAAAAAGPASSSSELSSVTADQSFEMTGITNVNSATTTNTNDIITTTTTTTGTNITNINGQSVLQVGQLKVFMKTTIGFGSQGTVVYKGVFDNREVAVKRMLLNFYNMASQEVAALQESDDHPNVIRYFCKYEMDQFLYIALELCPGTLGDIIEKPEKFHDLRDKMDPVQVIQQIASGLHHLHSLKIVHRDIKPQNILVAPPKKLPHGRTGPVRMMISDFGLCKKLEDGQSSFRNTRTGVGGTSGWTAPEITMGTRYPLSINGLENGSTITANGMNMGGRLTTAVDIFSLGCVFYYILTNGQHPFGPPTKRESNIEEDDHDLSGLDDMSLSDDPQVAQDLIAKMISFDWQLRPSASMVLQHPFFWPAQKKMNFLLCISDRFELEAREEGKSELLTILEKSAPEVVGEDWHDRLDRSFVETLNKYRKYRGQRLIDLLRAMRNKYHHFDDLPESLQAVMGPGPGPFLNYFRKRFPNLLTTVYYFAKENLNHEERFHAYFHDCE